MDIEYLAKLDDPAMLVKAEPSCSGLYSKILLVYMLPV